MTKLDIYLFLEQNMLELDAVDDDFADLIRDAMDPIWRGLTDEEKHLLDNRNVK